MIHSVKDMLDEVEALIVQERRHTGGRNDLLKAVAADLSGRLPGAPGVALAELERRMAAVTTSKTVLGHSEGALIGLGQEVIARWATIRRALEMFEQEQEKS